MAAPQDNGGPQPTRAVPTPFTLSFQPLADGAFAVHVLLVTGTVVLFVPNKDALRDIGNLFLRQATGIIVPPPKGLG
jgi:hypothetical protein